MKLSKYFKILMIKQNITMNELAENIDMNYKTLAGKFARNSFGDMTLIKIEIVVCIILLRKIYKP